MKKALITGVSGFSARHLAKYLIDQGLLVTGIDLNHNQYYQADLTDKKRLKEILVRERPDYIFHLASPIIRSKQMIDEALVKNLQVDFFGTINLLETAAGLKLKPRILITGTAAEYDIKIKGARKETDRLNPNTSYGLSKLTQELISRKLADSYGLELIYTRSFLLIGPGQRLGFVINDWCQQLASGKNKLMTGNLNIKRDFTDVRDAAAAYFTLMKKGKKGEIYNVCSGKSRQLKSIINALRQVMKMDLKVDEDKNRFKNSDPQELFGDNTKLKILGWREKISLNESLSSIIDYWRDCKA